MPANNFTGRNREITVDTTNDTVRVHDGVKAGGWPLVSAQLFAALDDFVVGAQNGGNFVKKSLAEVRTLIRHTRMRK